ncbi:MAG TPA: carboxypeptidase-like regulatory domain-containing protein, partial [Polyangia bacterium]
MTATLRSLVALLIAALVAAPARPGRAAPPRPAAVTGRVVDPAGAPVAGAEVFFYASANTKRPADFISPPTGPDGRYAAALPAGRYWAVARVRRGGPGPGPLAPGDRHSGAPETIDVRAGARGMRDFVVADLREMVRRSRKTRADYH